MNPQLLEAVNAGTAAMASTELRGEPASAAFRDGLVAFFLALPDGLARELLARKQPYHNWQTAFAAELSAELNADVPAAS